MRAAGLALACVVIGGGVAFGYIAADREVFAAVRGLDVFNRLSPAETGVYPLANRDGKVDRIAPLRTELADLEPAPNVLPRGDSLRQSYAAVDPAAPPPEPAIAAPPLPKPRPKAHLLRRQQGSYTLLSDLQIEAIRTRLKLTAEQERNWPAVETALRGLAVRLHEMKTSGSAPTDLAPDSAELVKLKAATTPFIAQLSADQKRELRMLAHVIGLGRVVAQL